MGVGGRHGSMGVGGGGRMGVWEWGGEAWEYGSWGGEAWEYGSGGGRHGYGCVWGGGGALSSVSMTYRGKQKHASGWMGGDHIRCILRWSLRRTHPGTPRGRMGPLTAGTSGSRCTARTPRPHGGNER